MKRREFFGRMSLLAGGALLSNSKALYAENKELEEKLQEVSDERAFWNVIRRQFVFPDDYTYLNTGGIGAIPSLVLHEVKKSMDDDQIYPNPGYDHERWERVKEICTGLLGPGVQKEELALISCATEGINIIINGVPLIKGDEIITSTHEHAALHIPLLNRLQRDGIKIRAFEPNFEDGLGNVRSIDKLITRRTKLIFVSHVTCTTGQIFPLAEIAKLAKSKNIRFAVDGAQAAGAFPIDLKNWGIDFYTFSGHKWCLGAKRTGVLYVPTDLLDTVRSIVVGAYSDAGYDIEKGTLTLHPTAQRYEFATQNAALFYGFGRGAEFVQTIGLKRIHVYNKKLAEAFYNGLQSIPNVQSLSPQEEKYRSSMISFKINGKDFHKVADTLTEEKQIRVRVVTEANVNGVRVSFHVYNNEDDVERILNEIKAIAKS